MAPSDFPVAFVPIEGAGASEGGMSKANHMEANAVVTLVHQFVAAGINQLDIGVTAVCCTGATDSQHA